LIIDALANLKLTGDWSKPPSGLFELLEGILRELTFLRIPLFNKELLRRLNFLGAIGQEKSFEEYCITMVIGD
jgi:hypothetical protein